MKEYILKQMKSDISILEMDIVRLHNNFSPHKSVQELIDLKIQIAEAEGSLKGYEKVLEHIEYGEKWGSENV